MSWRTLVAVRPQLELPVCPPLVPPPRIQRQLTEQVGDQAAIQLGDYLARLLAMNAQMNLTRIVDPDQAWERHILDALTLLPLVAAGSSLVDVGSGGGLPGIPLAIARPDLRVTLVEATQKKAAFLVAVANALGLSNVTVRAERAEALTDLRGTFDAVTARAVGRLALLLSLTAPLARPGGLLLLVKGQRADEELLEARAVMAEQDITHETTVDTPTGKIVVLRRARQSV